MTVIYDKVGGEVAINAAVDEFYTRVLNDDMLKTQFDKINLARLKKHQVDFLTTALGGPDTYTGRSLEKSHAGLGITTEQFERVVDHLAATLMSLGVDLATTSAIIQQILPLEPNVVDK